MNTASLHGIFLSERTQRKAPVYVAETNARADFTPTMLDFLSDIVLVPRHLYLVSSYRALKFTKWEIHERNMSNLQLVWELLTFFPTSGCRDALQNNSWSTPEASFITVHLLRLSPCWCCSVLTLHKFLRKRTDGSDCPAPKSCSSPKRLFLGQLTHPLPGWLPGH